MQNGSLKRGVYILLVTLAAFIYGMAVVKFHVPPYSLLKMLYSTTDAHTINAAPEATKSYLEVDVSRIISAKKPQDIARLRNAIVALLWDASGPPSHLPTVIDTNFVDTRYNDMPALRRIDRLRITMEFGLDSIVYHFIPRTPDATVVLYHQGHDGDFYKGKAYISRLLDSGYAVVAFSMPLLGLNSQPTVDFPRLGKFKITHHDQIKFLLPPKGHPVKYFVEPVIVALNYLDRNFDYSSIAMVGISGGGWATTLAAAIDPRIKMSFPVAGSYPIFLRAGDWGDYEQTAPEVYLTVNYLELYILGAAGHGRRQVQILNQYDPCCFSGNRWKQYKAVVSGRVHELGRGEFDIFADTTHREHMISPAAMDRIIQEIRIDRPASR